MCYTAPVAEENAPSNKKKKRKSAAELQKELMDLQKGTGAAQRAATDLKKIYVRVGLLVAVVWIGALFIPTAIPKIIAGVLTALAIGGTIWLVRTVGKSEALGDLLRGADTDEGRKEALRKLETDFKKGDSQALLARAQLEMQEDPRKALGTLESINLDKVIAPVADQVRALRANLHLTLNEAQAARPLVDKLELGKAQDAKSRAMFATVAGEAWARTGNAKKALETLELFNPEDPEFAEARIQMWRARAFAHAALNDTKAMNRALKKLADANPQLLAMFVGSKKIHPLLEKEAKNMLMRSGVVPRKMVRQRV